MSERKMTITETLILAKAKADRDHRIKILKTLGEITIEKFLEIYPDQLEYVAEKLGFIKIPSCEPDVEACKEFLLKNARMVELHGQRPLVQVDLEVKHPENIVAGDPDNNKTE